MQGRFGDGHSPSCSLQPSGSLPLVQRLWDSEGTCGVESCPQALGPQLSAGTLRVSQAQLPASRWVAVTDAPAPQPRLVQTLSSCRPAGTSAQFTHICSCAHLYTSHTILLRYMSYTCSHMSCTCSSAHIHICTAHVCPHVRWVTHHSLRQWCGL